MGDAATGAMLPGKLPMCGVGGWSTRRRLLFSGAWTFSPSGL